MAATTITRATITDDSGSGTDGTIINSAWVGTAIYDKVDNLFGANQTIEASTNAGLTHKVRNNSSGTAAYAGYVLGNDDTSNAFVALAFSTGYTTSAYYQPSTACLQSAMSGGMNLVASHASGLIKVYTGGSTARARWLAAGHFVVDELSTDPGTSDLTADAAVAVYTKSDKMVFAYNNSGTMTYVTIPLDGSTTTWTHGTSAP